MINLFIVFHNIGKEQLFEKCAKYLTNKAEEETQ